MAEHSAIVRLLQFLLLSLVLASWLYWLVATLLVYVFFRSENTRSTHGAGHSPLGRPAEPPVSILKPLKGVDEQAYANFSSFCRQDYPKYELVFGVADPADPVIPLVERLQQEFPDLTIRLVITDALGANRKASSLSQMVDRASHEILVVSDSDMRVTADYLSRVVAPLSDPLVGMVTCPYVGAEALTFTARLEALHMGVTFLPSVLVARQFLSMRFAMGATMVLRRADLERAGGFASVADFLADDYQLGLRLCDLGLRIILSGYVVRCILGATSFREQWDREVRWTRTNRANRPVEYPGLLLTFSVPLALALALVAPVDPLGWRVLAASIVLRWLVSWIIAGSTGDAESRRWLVWLPVRDLLSGFVWVAGGLGRRIVWRGEEFIVQPDGRLISVAFPGGARQAGPAIVRDVPGHQRPRS
jgi:ceramide glucosyltransferase